MRSGTTLFAASLALALAHPVFAQERPVVEIGTSLGASILSANGSSVTTFGIPGQGILGQSTLYGTFFTGSGLMLEPQLALSLVSSEGETATSLGFGGQAGYLFSGPTSNSAFIAGSLAYQSISGGGFSENDVGVGGKVGYRMVVGRSVGIRVEAGYRRWFDNDINEFSIGVGLGGIISKGN